MSLTPPQPDHDPWIGLEPTVSRRYVTVVVAAVTTIVLTIVAFLLPVPYATLQPGPVFDTLGDFNGEPMLSISGDVQTYPTDGALDFTTVSVTSPDGKVGFSEALLAWFDPNVNVVPKDFLYPEGETAEESDAQSAAQLASSKDNSSVAALRALGYEVPEQVRIGDVADDGASADLLESGDVVRAIDGTAVGTPQEAVDAVAEVTPGDVVTLAIERDGVPQDVAITTRPAADDPELPRIGVSLAASFDLPLQIDNNVGDSVGGPSAGTMFALAIYDLLTPGSLTGGRRVAGTGEISPEGVVGPIGGVRQKMAGAHADGAEVFLVPADNCAEAADGDDFGMTLVKITALDDAVSSLESLAADPDAKVPSCS
ncbi:MAG: PDZ domain-containing protein [Aeromicrobium sp.]|uniref:YlbL family protein n=1 Tax=Aeromicrobium sp. TaxID=1871063 RepID=UPI002619FF3A|nr:S16 family serine protease [Aeromicrobium sp.]MDF1706417.1 PDZ domain-containing protein [Aeromicrobium sp.]